MKRYKIYTETIKAKKNTKKEIYLHKTTQKNLEKKLNQISKQTPLLVFDITHIKNKKDGEVFYIKDHINKTGENPQQGKEHVFLDLSQLYTQHPKGITTTCLGKRYKDNKNKHLNPSTNICNVAIKLKALGFLNITGKLINSLK